MVGAEASGVGGAEVHDGRERLLAGVVQLDLVQFGLDGLIGVTLGF